MVGLVELRWHSDKDAKTALEGDRVRVSEAVREDETRDSHLPRQFGMRWCYKF